MFCNAAKRINAIGFKGRIQGQAICHYKEILLLINDIYVEIKIAKSFLYSIIVISAMLNPVNTGLLKFAVFIFIQIEQYIFV